MMHLGFHQRAVNDRVSDRNCPSKRGATYEKCSVESGNHAKDVENETVPAASNAKDSFIGKLGFDVALLFPGSSESNMGKADAAPDEEIGQAGQGQEPVENGRSILRLSDESQKSEGKLDNHTPDRSTMLIYMGQERWGHSSLSECLHCAGRSEGT